MIIKTAFEKSIKHEMTREKYEGIRDHVYGDGKNTFNYTYGDVSSWFTWNRDGNGQMAKVRPPAPEYTHRNHKFDGPIADWKENDSPEFASRITTDIVFAGLNMSGTGKPFIDSAGNNWPRFQNARGHRRIVDTFFNTAAEGAYFTDLIKPDKRFLSKVGKPANGAEVMRIVRAQPDVLKEHIHLFKKELDFIGAKKPLLIVFGAQADWILRRGLDKNFLENRFHAIVRIMHYSGYPAGGDEGYKKETRQKLASYITIS